MTNAQNLLTVENLTVRFKTPDGFFDAVKSASFSLKRGKTLGIVGESGSGKSVTALSIMQLLPYPLASHPNGSILFNGQELVNAKMEVMNAIRGAKIGMIFQEPLSSLNPLHTISKQIAEVVILHNPTIDKTSVSNRVGELLDIVGLTNLRTRLNAYPHELSGGQRQRVMIAMALANTPDILIADEPTTALDVTVQAQILDLLKSLQSKLGMAMILISHDLKVVEKMCDHVCVMKSGEIVESQKKDVLFANPQHAYTQHLLASSPRQTPIPCTQNGKIILDVKDIQVKFPVKKNLFGKVLQSISAVDKISFSVSEKQTLGIVGESGSGKTTLALALLKLIESDGQIIFDGHDITSIKGQELRALRAKMQIVFQDPFGSLSPRMTVAQIIGEGLVIHKPDLSDEVVDSMVSATMEQVGLNPDMRHRYPHEFSGGQRQRISIARALILEPKLIVLDEPTSALDVSVQKQVVELLQDLQEKLNLTYLFISHDLRVVQAMAHDVLVMKNGQIVEFAPATQIFQHAKMDYTKSLISAALSLKA
jgi:microcin C transport system ATP-binding protein